MFFRKGLPFLIPVVLAGAVGTVWWGRSPRVNASLYDLVGREAERIPKFVREASSGEIAIIVSSAEEAEARLVAKRIGEKLASGQQARDSELGGEALTFLRENRSGLVIPETARLLETAEGRTKIARRAVRRLYSAPIPPILGYADDPFGLSDGFLATLLPKTQAKTEEGYPILATNGETHVLIDSRLDAATVADIDRTIAFCEKVRNLARAGTSDTEAVSPVSVRFAGAPVHTALSARRCKGEIGVLTWFSLAVIAALALFAFRSWRWLPILAGSLLVSALAGGLALVCCFREIHVMTLVMGTTVLGLVIDYSFHWLLSPAEAKRSVMKGMLVSFVTTEISLVPLMLASIPVLRQSAVFLGVGLSAALGYVFACYPRGVGSTISGRAQNGRAVTRVSRLASSRVSRLASLALLIVFLFASVGLFRVSVKADVTALYTPPTELLEAEKLRAAFGTFDLLAVPPFAVRRAIAANVERLYAEHGAEMAKTLDLATLAPPPAPKDVPLRPKALMEAIFGAWTREAVRRLGWSLLALVAVVAVLCRRRAIRALAPPLAALAVVAGALGWAGVPINLFHLLAAFLLLGMGVDYAVFLGSGERSAFKPALCSLLTSVAGFGALAFVSFPVVRSFGVVLGIGLPVAFIVALWGRAVPAASSATEHGASLLGLEILLFLYRLFGLRALHFLAAGVGLCVWAFSPAVRRATSSVRKLRFFTRSLADKLVVLAEGRSLPCVETDGSPDAVQFAADVRSGKGVFVLSSHVGTIEVLTALGACERTFHAWMDFGRTSVFNRFYLRHARRRSVVIHPISEFGMGTVFKAGDWIDAGDCLVMAGDRGDGAFRFAAAFDHPVYFVACLAEAGCRYRAVIRRLPSDRVTMKAAYDERLAELARAHPEQHFVWGAANVV